ncbi:MAG: hypothetical protein JRI48_10860 [Deltaproteobacteria bacterium]|nr:hypothetical protein [Deltaproteobacteria bacterium]
MNIVAYKADPKKKDDREISTMTLPISMANRFVIAIFEAKRRADRKAIPARILLFMPCLNVTFVSSQILCI